MVWMDWVVGNHLANQVQDYSRIAVTASNSSSRSKGLGSIRNAPNCFANVRDPGRRIVHHAIREVLITSGVLKGVKLSKTPIPIFTCRITYNFPQTKCHDKQHCDAGRSNHYHIPHRTFLVSIEHLYVDKRIDTSQRIVNGVIISRIGNPLTVKQVFISVGTRLEGDGPLPHWPLLEVS